jgi:hypothetical protein
MTCLESGRPGRWPASVFGWGPGRSLMCAARYSLAAGCPVPLSAHMVLHLLRWFHQGVLHLVLPLVLLGSWMLV